MTERPGVTVETVRRGDDRLGEGGVPADRVAAQAFSSFDSATIVTVGTDAEVAEPIEITVTGPGEGATAYGHLQVRVERARRGDRRHRPARQRNLRRQRRVRRRRRRAADASSSIADWADDAVHVSAHHAALGKDAVLRHVAVTLGGDLVRLTATRRVRAAPAATPSCSACTSPTTASTSSQRLLVDHAQPNCRSHVLVQGCAARRSGLDKPDAHTVWIGDVLIRAAATGTDTFETNRNLVLTDGARADSVPNLEIETGEIVGAGHASATGRFDDEQLFYLQARGIPEDQARRLVVRGFFGEIISQDRRARACASASTTPSNRTSRSPESKDTHDLMTTLEIKDLHVSVAAEDGAEDPDPQGRRPHRDVGRDPRDHGPERLRQVDAVLRDRRPPEVHGHRRARSRSTARTCSR